MLDETNSAEEHAEICFELWNVTEQEKDRQVALAHFQQLYDHHPKRSFQEKITHLKAGREKQKGAP